MSLSVEDGDGIICEYIVGGSNIARRRSSLFGLLLYAGGENGEGLLLVLALCGFLATVGATAETVMLGAVPLDVSIQVAQVTLCVPVFFAWAVSGVETSFVFVPASASISELIEGYAV